MTIIVLTAMVISRVGAMVRDPPLATAIPTLFPFHSAHEAAAVTFMWSLSVVYASSSFPCDSLRSVMHLHISLQDVLW